MTRFTQKSSDPVFSTAIRNVTLALLLVVFGASVALAQNKKSMTSARDNAASANDEQVPWTATGTAVITGVTRLPGGLDQVNFSTSGKATHLGDVTGPLIRIQDHQGTFGSTAVIVGANGKDTFDLCAGTAKGTYTGTISKPNSN